MTLEEAIKHCHEKAEEIRKANEEMPTDCKLSEDLCECAREHEQLAEWLKDYKRLLETPRGDLISREALKKDIEKRCGEPFDYIKTIVPTLKAIDNAPTVPQVTVFTETADEKAVADLKAELQSVIEPRPQCNQIAWEQGYEAGLAQGKQERPQGEWIKITKNGTIPVEYICSVCGRKIFDNYELSVPQSVYYPFCHCGADMRKGGKE